MALRLTRLQKLNLLKLLMQALAPAAAFPLQPVDTHPSKQSLIITAGRPVAKDRDLEFHW